MAKLLYDCPMYGLKAGDEIELMNVNQSKCDEFWKRNPDIKKKYFKGEDCMEKYEFHVGDVVVTTDDRYGYVEDICTCNQCKERGFCEPRVVYEDGLVDYITNYEAKIGFKGYKRIGKYDFTKPEKKNKIEPLEPIEDGCTASTHLFQKVVVKKLNEIIACINKREE